jgi:TctA family transporter
LGLKTAAASNKMTVTGKFSRGTQIITLASMLGVLITIVQGWPHYTAKQ